MTPNWFRGPELPGLVARGVVLYLLVRVIRDEGGRATSAASRPRIALGIVLFPLAAGGFAAAAAGSALGGGILVAGTVIALGVALVGGAFRGGARWLIVPAFVLALPLGVVSAADLELDGDVGRAHLPPASSRRRVGRLRHGRRPHAGRPPRRRAAARPDGAAGQARRRASSTSPCRSDVCVTYDVEVGVGEIRTLDGIADGGVDLDVTGAAPGPGGRARAARDRRPGRRRRAASTATSRTASSSAGGSTGPRFDGGPPARLPQRGLRGGGMKARPGFDPGSLVAGVIIIVARRSCSCSTAPTCRTCGFDYWWPLALAAVGGVLLACGLAGPSRGRR